MADRFEQAFAEEHQRDEYDAALKLFASLVQKDNYVGEVYSISYESALVQIHDYYRQQVGGIPGLSLLVATRVNPDEEFDPQLEDTSVILLRVMDAAPLPNEAEAQRVRVESAQRVTGEPDVQWDSTPMMDASTHHLLSFAGVRCRVLGTFYLDDITHPDGRTALGLRFGTDLSNYYPNRGLKVFKPNGVALQLIVNYREISEDDQTAHREVEIGVVRYASTNRAFQGVSDVPVSILPSDLLGQKTALFGMTRTGKSNTTKIIIESVFRLRFGDRGVKIGQLVFDPNGEYANENVQDANAEANPSAIKNVWRVDSQGMAEDVVTYGLLKHPNDPDRHLMLLNFFLDENLSAGKQIIDSILPSEGIAYISNFRQVAFDEAPPASDRSALTRHNRRVLVYRGLLAKAGFVAPDGLSPRTQALFNQELLDALTNSGDANYLSAALQFGASAPSWNQIAMACEYLEQFIREPSSGFQAFNQTYVNRPGGSGDPWADPDLLKLLGMFRYANGPRMMGLARPQHSPLTSQDFSEEVYEHLEAGRLVIIDQSSGEPDINRASAERIMWKVFRENQQRFRTAAIPPEIMIYVEEAHNLLPSGSDTDLSNVWVRAAKEGAKLNLGLVYTTQEVSSIQRNILKNTSNWFIGHLNNTDETREISKFYDFIDFEPSIRRAQDRGFVRMKTLSNKFVVPIQVRRFQV